jgi:hypothetical protein
MQNLNAVSLEHYPNILLTFQGKIMNVQKTLFIPIFLFLTVGWFTIGCGEKKFKTEYITGAVIRN